ncbi:MAG: ATP-binding protein [Acidobacteriota bacterium]|nr:ATP-binding protein [Acidobacteriota bacterium]
MPPLSSRLTLSFGSRIEALDLLDDVAAVWLNGVSAEAEEVRCEQIGLALREAAANAILHGNDSREDKKVQIELSFRNPELLIRVKDEGEGFDPDSLPDPLLPENLMRKTGRGILLMRAYMNEVDFEFDGGTVAIMRCAFAGEADTPGR